MTLRGKGLLVVRSNRMEGRTAMASLSLEHIGKKYPNGCEGVKDFNLDIADKKFIIFDECVKTLTIHTDNTTYQMQVDEKCEASHFSSNAKRMIMRSSWQRRRPACFSAARNFA